MKDNKKVYKKVLLSLSIIISLMTNMIYANPLYLYETLEKEETTFKTSSYSNFSDTLPYEDGSGYKGVYTKNGDPYVISGESSKSKWVSTVIDSRSPSDSFYYDDGSYSGYIDKKEVTSSTKTKSVSGSASVDEAINRICTQGGKVIRNTNYDPKKFNNYDTSTWEFWEVGSIWSAPFTRNIGAHSASSNFLVNWNGTTPTSASYDDGEYSGLVNVSSDGVITYTWDVYKSNPGNGYSPPSTGQESQVQANQYRYRLSGVVSAPSYKVKYEGYVHTRDSRVWRQNYKGTMRKIITHTLDAEITHDIPEKMKEKEKYKVNIKATNTGTVTWNEKTKIRLGNYGGDFPFEKRLYLPDNVEIKTGESYTWNIEVVAPMKSPKEYNIQLKMIKDDRDNGWFGNNAYQNILVYDYIPYSGDIEVKKYDYYDKKISYWVKPNSPVEIYSNGYFDSKTQLFPHKNYISLEDNLDNIEMYSSEQGSNTNNKKVSLNNNKASKIQKENKNYLQSTKAFKINNKDTAYKILYKSSYEKNSIEYTGEYKDSGKWLKIDGTAPKGEVEIDEPSLGEISVNAHNIIEEGSGLNKVWVEYTSADKTITETLKNTGNQYKDLKDIKTMFSNEIDYLDIVVKASDNVGNIGVLKNEKVYLFSVNAEIERVLKPHAPVFKSGEKGLLKIDLKGAVERVKITFPNELTRLDSSLNREIILEPKNKDYIEYGFFIPIDALEKSYKVQVIGYKKGKEKTAYPPFSVNGNILDDIRTRIRIKE